MSILRLPKGKPAVCAPYDVPLLCCSLNGSRTGGRFYFVARRTRGPIPGEGYPPGADLSTWAILPGGRGVDRPDVFWELPQ